MAEKSRQITDRLLQTAWYQNAEIIYGYAPLSNEVDDREFLEQALSEGESGRTVKDRCGTVRWSFIRSHRLHSLVEGRFHVMEPDESCPICTAATPVHTGSRSGL